MNRFSSLCRRLLWVLAVSSVAFGFCYPAAAAEDGPTVAYGEVYCFTPGDFQADSSEPITGIFVTGVPADTTGRVCIGQRVIRQGDVLTAQQVSTMVFQPAKAEYGQATIRFMPIYARSVEQEASMTISITGKDKTPPTVQDSTLETYKNLANSGKLTAQDPEGSAITFTITKQPKRGDLKVESDGSFTYTPRKNKVGKDYFTYTATDAAGNVSVEATVSIQIKKPLDNEAYKDMTTSNHQFEALWLKNTGLFSGTVIAGEACFVPDAAVTRGEFLAMAMKLLEIPVDEAAYAAGFADEAQAPDWLRPYLSTAMRLGLVSGSREAGSLVFRPNEAITQAEAAVMLQSAMALQTSGSSLDESVPVWAEEATAAMAENGISLTGGSKILTREDAAVALYQVSRVLPSAPGLSIFQSR